jgi:hypothetical protein
MRAMERIMNPATMMPQSPCLSILQFFGSTYTVPPFQRGFAWQEDQIRQLLEDFHEFLNGNEPIYLLGQVIVAPANGDTEYELIDGQQRTTSLMLLLLALYRRFERMHESQKNNKCKYLQTQLHQLIIYATKMGELKPRITVSKDGIELVEALVNNEKLPEITGWTRENIKEVYDTITDFLDEHWPDISITPDLYNDIVTRVYIVRLELLSPDEAVHVFERINNRGLSLSSADLIKNLIFRNVNEQDYLEHVSDDWEKASTVLYQCRNGRVKTMEYLLRAMLLIDTGENVSNRDMRYRWEKKLKTDISALHFSKSLPLNALIIKNIDSGKTPSGKENTINEGSTYFNMVQHYPILLAAEKLNPEAFNYLARIVEDRVIVSLMAKERPQDFERIIPIWGNNIKKLASNAGIDDLTEASEVALRGLAQILQNAYVYISGFRVQNATQKKRIRYILARISRQVQIDAAEPIVPSLNEFLTTSKSSKAVKLGYDIEHIRPSAFYGGEDLTNAIGNLVFAHPMDQRAAGALAPIDKIDVYRTSNLVLTRSLCDSDVLILNQSQQQSIRRIHEVAPPSLSNWNDSAIHNRTELYWRIFLSSLSIRPR